MRWLPAGPGVRLRVEGRAPTERKRERERGKREGEREREIGSTMPGMTPRSIHRSARGCPSMFA